MKRDHERRRQVSAMLKALFDCATAEPVPQSIHDTLRGLK